jgi:hypothetical protein
MAASLTTQCMRSLLQVQVPQELQDEAQPAQGALDQGLPQGGGQGDDRGECRWGVATWAVRGDGGCGRSDDRQAELQQSCRPRGQGIRSMHGVRWVECASRAEAAAPLARRSLAAPCIWMHSLWAERGCDRASC